MTNAEQKLRTALARSSRREKTLLRALEESVRLQSYYASLLNTNALYVGGRYMEFADAEAWLTRLRATARNKL